MMNHMMGTGYLGETRMGPDGNLYQWVEGIDGLGNPIGFWNKLKKLGKRAVRTVARYYPPAQALKLVSPGSGYDGLGSLYQAADGSLYQMQGLSGDEEGMGADDLTQVMGLGSYLGETRMGPDGNIYQWVQGVDGLGNPIGFWKKWKKKLRGFVQKTLPLAQKIAPFVPGGSAVLTAATPFLKQAGIAGHNGLGALYQAPDGTLYQMQGLAEDEALYGYGEDEELQGLAEGDLQGYGEEELDGLTEDEELQGYGEEDEMQGMEGYIRQNNMSGLEKYEPQQAPTTRWFNPPSQTPEIWKAPW
ncbi:MAG: hypothetical protein EDM05_56615 [Leptolyngbya sp. IPPAS B-1204]